MAWHESVSNRVLPGASFEQASGATITIYAGSLMEFPAWFEVEVDALVDRLKKEARAIRQPQEWAAAQP